MMNTFNPLLDFTQIECWTEKSNQNNWFNPVVDDAIRAQLFILLGCSGVAERAQTWGGGPLLNFHFQCSLGGASRHLARTHSQVQFGLANNN